jgi:DNA-binding NarL/FixJ family response regulator
VRVILGSDHRLFADALADALVVGGVLVARQVRTPRETITAAITHPPHVCLISARWLHGDDGRLFRALHPAIKLVAMSEVAADARLLAAAADAGAAAVVSQHQQVAGLIEMLRRVCAGERPLDAIVTPPAVRALRKPIRPSHGGALRLTLREQEVLMLIADGHATREIATALAITPHTARTHVQSVLMKLGAHSRLEASGMAVRAGLLGPYAHYASSRAAQRAGAIS